MNSSDDRDSAAGRSRAGRAGPAGIGEMFDRIIGEDNPVFGQIDRNARALAQSALAKLDVVGRAEFDAQTAVLMRTRQKVELLEAEVARLTELLEDRSNSNQ